MATVVSMPSRSGNKPSSVSITPEAARQIIRIRQEESNDALKLRVYVDGGGCSGFQYGFEMETDCAGDDVVINGEGGAQLLVDTTSLPYLDGAEVDFENTLAGAHFIIRNPNAKSTCGCGTSFTVAGQ